MVISSTADNVEYFGKFLALREMTQVALTNEKLAKYVLNMCVLLENVTDMLRSGTWADARDVLVHGGYSIVVLRRHKSRATGIAPFSRFDSPSAHEMY